MIILIIFSRIEAADQIITEQQLGLKYEPTRVVTEEETKSEKRSAMDFARSVMSESDFSDSAADKVFRVLCEECAFLVEEKLT